MKNRSTQKSLLDYLSWWIEDNTSGTTLEAPTLTVDEEFLELIKNQKLLPTLFRSIAPLVSDKNITKKYSLVVQEQDIRSRTMLNELANLFRAANRRGIKFVVVKGIVLSWQIYGDIYSRQCGDMDLLMAEETMYKMDHLLRCHDYEQFNELLPEQTFEHPFLKSKASHEFYPYRKTCDGTNVYAEVARSLHSRIAGVYIKTMLDALDILDIENQQVPALSPQDTLIQLVENTYENSEGLFNILSGNTVLRDYLDLIMYLKKQSLLPQDVVDIVERYGFEEEARVVFINLSYVFPNVLIVKGILSGLGYSESENYIPDHQGEFWDKIFNHDKNRKKYLRDFKSEIYGPNNKYVKSPYNESFTLHVPSGKGEYELITCKFKVDVWAHQLICDFNIPRTVLDNLEQHLIELRIYNNNLNSMTSLVAIDLFAEGGELYYYINHGENNKNGSQRNIKKGLMMAEKIVVGEERSDSENFRFMIDYEKYSFFIKADVLLAADISYYEKLDVNVYNLIVTNYEDDHTVPLLFIKQV